ncbi:Ferrichrome-iron receptor [Pseudomonas amygdali pv. morsprunorum]|nr:Ferrichrome-iron receptor [Pseudomonas amygdali pv. morsprunorum]
MLSALSLAMCASGAVHAAETATLPATQVSAAATEGREGYSAESTSTASKSDVPIKEEAQSVNVVTPQTIADYNVRSLDDAMKFVSGVSQGNTLGNTKDSVIKRGFGRLDPARWRTLGGIEKLRCDHRAR